MKLTLTYRVRRHLSVSVLCNVLVPPRHLPRQQPQHKGEMTLATMTMTPIGSAIAIAIASAIASAVAIALGHKKSQLV